MEAYWGFVAHYQATGLAHRLLDRIDVPRENRLQVDQLAADAHFLRVRARLLKCNKT